MLLRMHITRSNLQYIVTAVFLSAAICCGAAASAFAAEQLPPLGEAELMVTDGPEVLAAIAAMERDTQLAELERQRKGVKYFVGARYGYSDEPLFETSEESKTYQKLTVTAGLSFPLLGTWNQQKINALEAEIRSIESKYRPAVLKLHNLTALRKAYISLWVECGKIAIAESFLSTEAGVSKILAERQQKGLLLPADRLEAVTGYEMARRDIAVSRLKKVQALQIIRLVTGRLWQMPDKMEMPTLPGFTGLTPRIDDHPELVMRRETLKRYEKLVKEKRYPSREGNFNIGGTVGKDFPGSTGTGVYASVNLTEPLKTLFSKDDKANLAASADLKRAEKEETFMRIKIEGESEETFAYAEYASANIKTQEARLASMSEAVRERILRHVSIAGDTFERLQASRYQYYRVAADMLDSEMIFMQTGADLLSYAYPGGVATEPASRFKPIDDNVLRTRLLNPDWLTSTTSVPGGKAQIKPLEPERSTAAQLAAAPTQTTKAETAVSVSEPPKSAEQRPVQPAKREPVKQTQQPPEEQPPLSEDKSRPDSVYVWDAAPLLDQSTRDSQLIEMQGEGFERILVSLNPAQIAGLDNFLLRVEIDKLLSAAHTNGMKAELLLGDPHWLYPAERTKLVDIIKRVSAFKFDGIHLDIEQDSLPGAENKRAELFGMLLDTVAAAKDATKLPLSLSLHPRYLEGDFGAEANRRLGAIGVDYVTVMIYSSKDINAVAKRFSTIAICSPTLKLRLAQSVETSLPADESYHHLGPAGYASAMDELINKLSASGSFRGIIIQSWEDYVRGGMIR